MMKFIFLLLFFIAGCASQAPVTGQIQSSTEAFGTLADGRDVYEMSAAPVITKSALVRTSTARALRRQEISADDARDLKLCTDNAIDKVNFESEHPNLIGIGKAGEIADSCLKLLDELKGKSK